MAEKEKQEAFEESETARLALLHFGQFKLHLEFDKTPHAYPPEVNEYIGEVEYIIQNRTRMGRDDILRHDYLRDQFHTKAGQALVNKQLAPNLTLGRELVRLLAIDLGLTTFTQARQRSPARKARIAAIRT